MRVVHTAELTDGERSEIRALLDRAFGGGFGDEDWEHSLGGLHVLVEVDGAIVGHAALVQRRLLHRARALRAGYVEAVAAEPRGQGHGAGAMAEVERIVRAAYDLGALSASEAAYGFYEARGWIPWQGPTAVLAPDGLTRTPDDDDSTFVLPVGSTDLDPTGLLACDWRDGDVW
ncbi:GNAT family N-acetyltransferase [Dactylosporangium sp. NPDC000521]|uniref:GNAT family N-acetyltransferase n=1 Tax=Dactylosporangium sp. NPDC000521 TaxID=3363975 RepID=UPI00368597F9